IANLAFSAVVVAMTETLATAMFRDRIVGRAAVLLLTFYPNQIGWVPMLSTEIFYETLLLLCVWLLMQERLVPALVAGLLFGVAMLTKTQTLLIPGCLFLGALLAAPSHRALLRLAGLASVVYVAMLLVVAPWTYRNYTVFDAFIPVATNGGFTLLTGNNPEADGDYVEKTSLAEGISHDPAEQVVMDRLASARAVAWIKANPATFVELLPKKLFRLWIPDGESEWYYQRGYADYDAHVLAFRTVRVLNQVYYFALLLLALPWLWRHSGEMSPWATAGLSLVVCFSLISMVFSGQSRFHACLMPFVAMYSAWTLVRILRSRRL
ncbi:MAG: glycosyl transferase, partial [Alphaproteobacteria bacterium]|nr:glycosyl transferase [Alphaproteobacteria bacterium]